jgi:hypothetical protein
MIDYFIAMVNPLKFCASFAIRFEVEIGDRRDQDKRS